MTILKSKLSGYDLEQIHSELQQLSLVIYLVFNRMNVDQIIWYTEMYFGGYSVVKSF